MALRIPISVCLCEVDVVLEKRGGGLRSLHFFRSGRTVEKFVGTSLYGGHNLPSAGIGLRVDIERKAKQDKFPKEAFDWQFYFHDYSKIVLPQLYTKSIFHDFFCV